jgi:fumarate reductase subunit C
MNVRLFLAQRLSALILAPLVLVHLGLIIYATRNGISASEILGRTRGSLGWAAFYSLFVLAAAVHGAIGIRGVTKEWGPRRLARSARGLDALMWTVGLALAALGLRAVYAVSA